MNVETFEVEEVASSTPDQCEEAARITEQLGLEGQNKFYRLEHSCEVSPTAFPYRKMTAREVWVYSRVLPAKIKLEKYSDGPIPLRVLQVAAHAKTCFENEASPVEFQVWHPENADYRDPLLVVRVGKEYGPNEHYMLARWGESLEEFGVLLNRAKEIYRTWCIKTLQKEIDELQSALARVPAFVEAHALTGKTISCGAYCHD